MTILIVYTLLSIMLLVSHPHVEWHKLSRFLAWSIFIIFFMPILIQHFWAWNWDSENNKIKYPERGIKINHNDN